MTKPLLLNDLLHLSPEDIARAKIRFNKNTSGTQGKPAMQVYLENPDDVNTRMLFWTTKVRFFSVNDIAICFFQLSSDTWLLSTIKEVTRELGVSPGINYEGIEMEQYRPYFARVIVKYHKTHMASYRKLDGFLDKLEVLQILSSAFDGIDFPGYDKVRLSFEQLSIVINRRPKDWIPALENQKAVYLITDMASGQQYVGSATGENGMLLQRWANYVADGHGGNKYLKAIVDNTAQGMDYVMKNFQYSILENYNASVDKHIILEREAWWKETLGSKAHGLNAN